MKLLVRRDQKQVKGWLGGDKGVMFSMFVQAELAPDERALIQKYKFENALLHDWETRKPGGDPGETIWYHINVAELVQGKEFEANNIGDLLENEEKIIEAAHSLKRYLAAAATFGGERVIDI